MNSKIKSYKKKKNRPFKYSKFRGEMSGRETDVSRMYPPILNCRYRNDKIVFDWTKYEPPIDIEDERR